jgi:hypothetical protein
MNNGNLSFKKKLKLETSFAGRQKNVAKKGGWREGGGIQFTVE